jgi:hypothetical protein
VTCVLYLKNFFRIDGCEKAGPAGAAVKLGLRGKERFTGDNVYIDPGLFVVPVGIVERRFGASFAGDVVLIRGESLLQIFEGMGHGRVDV